MASASFRRHPPVQGSSVCFMVLGCAGSRVNGTIITDRVDLMITASNNGIIWLCKTRHHLCHVQDQIFSPHWEEIKFKPLLRLLPQWRVTIKHYFWYLFEWILLNNEGKLKLSVKSDRIFKTNEGTETSFQLFLQSVLLPLMAVLSGIQMNSNKVFSFGAQVTILYTTLDVF